LGERRGSKRIDGLLLIGACVNNEKSATICGVTSRSADYVKTKLETSQN
jgi:hypothetical protein